MPIYVYKCPECGTYFERLAKISEMDSQVCDCGNKDVERQPTAPANISVVGYHRKVTAKDIPPANPYAKRGQ